MKCPACPAELSEISAYGLKLDVCTESCGGVWFDPGELEQLDELEEKVDDRVLRPLSNQRVALDRTKQRSCPRCPATILTHHLQDPQSAVEIDLCPTCGGAWLDFGELDTLRQNNSADENRGVVINEYLERYAKDPKSAPKGLRAVCELLFRG